MTKEEGFSNLFFKWVVDKERNRLIFCTVPDTRGRNIWRHGNSWIHFPRWIEVGYLNELMRLTDFINSLPLLKRKRLNGLAFHLMRPTETLIGDLWKVAKERMPLIRFFERYIEGI